MTDTRREAIRLVGVEKKYPNGHTAIERLDLAVAAGEFLVLVGPSGSGKSTVLRLIAGLESPTAGRVLIGNDDVTDAAPQDRDLAMVFQSYALYPHMSVRENLGYGLKVRKTDPVITAQRVGDVAQSLGIASLLDRRPAQLSGGERQRVALGRALVRQPRAFLFDEPLSNLDPALRADARAELRRLHRELGITAVYVTHDQEEAMTLGGRIAVMRLGHLEQMAPPRDVYARPANTFVAQFVGAPAMNLVPAARLGVAAPPGALAGIRPHDIVVGSPGDRRATVDLVESRGHDQIVHLRLQGGPDVSLVAIIPEGLVPEIGSTVFLTLPDGKLHLFSDADGKRIN